MEFQLIEMWIRLPDMKFIESIPLFLLSVPLWLIIGLGVWVGLDAGPEIGFLVAVFAFILMESSIGCTRHLVVRLMKKWV